MSRATPCKLQIRIILLVASLTSSLGAVPGKPGQPLNPNPDAQLLTSHPASHNVAAALVVVTNPADSGFGSLRQMISDASPGSLITFSPELSGQTINLTSGQIVIDKALDIDASALQGGITLDGNLNSRILFLTSGSIPYTVSLNCLTLTRGSVGGSAGGAIRTQTNTTLIVLRSTFFDNHASTGSGDGGAILCEGQMIVENCTFTQNSAADRGGAIRVSSGGGTLRHVTISGNEADQGGGIYQDEGTLILINSIVAGNSGRVSGPDLLHTGFVSFINCLLEIDPELSDLGDFGGPTLTMRPLKGSPAIDAGDNDTTQFLNVDQRGYDRLFGSAVDIGAVEYGSGLILTIVDNQDQSVTLSWPTWASDYFLEFSTLVGSDAVWDLVFELPKIEGDFFKVRIFTLYEGSQYYRLSQ